MEELPPLPIYSKEEEPRTEIIEKEEKVKPKRRVKPKKEEFY
jgi:hypothetical protein